MKRYFFRISAALLCIIVVFSLAACKHKNGGSSSGSASLIPASDSSIPSFSLGEASDIVDTATGEVYKAPVYNMSNESVKFLSHWTAETVPFVVQYMRKYGGPEIDFITASYSDCGMKLQAMVLAGQSPDVYKIRDGDLTQLMRQGIFTDLTNLFDWDSRNWKSSRPYLDLVTFRGQILAAPEMNSNYFIWYNKSIFNEYGIEDPIKLYESKEWTLDKFRETCKKLTIREGGLTNIYGFGYDHTWLRQVFAFFDAQCVRQNGDTFVNSLGDGKMELAANYVYQMYNVDRVCCAQQKAPSLFASGKLAMMWYGNWLSDISPFGNMCKTGVIDLVPAPYNPETGLGYRQDYVMGGHSIPVGATNLKGAVAFIEIFNFYKETPELDMDVTRAEFESVNRTEEQFWRMRGVRQYENNYSFIEIGNWDEILFLAEDGNQWLNIKEIYEPKLQLMIDSIPQ